MAIAFIKNKTMPIGLDFGSSAMKMLQLRQKEDALELIAAHAENIPSGPSHDHLSHSRHLTKSLRQGLKQNQFKGRQCILSLPSQVTLVQHVKVPELTGHELEDAVRWELHDKLPYPVDEAVIRHVVAGKVRGEGESRQEVIAIAVRKSVLEGYLDIACRAGLDIIGVNIASCAIVECFARLFRRTNDTARTILFVDIGSTSTQAVLSHGPNIVFARDLTTAGVQIDEAVAKGLKVPVEQAHSVRMDLLRGKSSEATADELYHLVDAPVHAITEELTKCLRYYESVFRNQSVERVIFVGGQAFDKRLCLSIAKRMNLPAQIGDPLSNARRIAGAGLEIGLDRREPQPNWAVAVGLCLGANRAA